VKIKSKRMDYGKILILFYNRVSGKNVSALEEIPPEVITFLSALDPKDLKRPFILEEIKAGNIDTKITIKLSVDRSAVRHVRFKFGYLQPHK